MMGADAEALRYVTALAQARIQETDLLARLRRAHNAVEDDGLSRGEALELAAAYLALAALAQQRIDGRVFGT